MIIKSFEEKKINLNNQKIHLLYGENQGHINDFVDQIFKKKFHDSTYYYEESEIITDESVIYNQLQTKSFFDDNKLIIIRRVTDKVAKLIEKILEKNVSDVNFVLTSNILEKKSKLRTLFEKNNKLVCIPFYQDKEQSLINIITNFSKEKKINFSRRTINLLIKRAMNDRQNLKNELFKIEAYSINKKTVNEDEILKLTNHSENYDVSTLVDYCLLKNEKKILEILNENIFSIDECIKILRIFLAKSKRLLLLSLSVKEYKNIQKAIEAHKPPIFWKDKEILKKQLEIWPINNIKSLINRINNTELLIKKNSSNSIIILLNFVFLEASENINNNFL